MSISDLASIDIRPSMSPSKSAGTRDIYVPRSDVISRSAEGCSGLVCIVIGGTGRTISSWSTLAYPQVYTCSFAAYWEPTGADLLDTGTEVCGAGGGTFVGYLPYPIHHNYNYHACNTWAGIGGKPCEYIHS
jgi:hypothetical protein